MTKNEEKVLEALKYGGSTVAVIHEMTGIAENHLYAILAGLESQGLATSRYDRRIGRKRYSLKEK